MPVELQFPLYALADIATSQTVYGGSGKRPRLLLFTSAEKASNYRRRRELVASVIRLREPRDLRILLSLQDKTSDFDVEIDAE
ncbi:MAG TPA: hypothetical protein VF175_18650 [Lacipirellula sp.]